MKILAISVLLAAMALPALAQEQRLSPDDQRSFDNYYQKWVNDSQRNDRDDIRRDEQRMQDIMQRYNIPQDVPYDRIASAGQGYGNGREGDRDRDRDNDGYGQRRDYDRGGPQLAPADQQRFDSIYSKWLNDTRRNDRDDIRKDERKMRDIMVRYNISPDTPFDAVASRGYR